MLLHVIICSQVNCRAKTNFLSTEMNSLLLYIWNDKQKACCVWLCALDGTMKVLLLRLIHTHHSTNHDNIRSQDFADGENVKYPDDPQHDIEAVERVTNCYCTRVNTETNSNKKQNHSTSVTQVPFTRCPFFDLFIESYGLRMKHLRNKKAIY